MTFEFCLKFFNTYYDFFAIGMFAALVLFVFVNVIGNNYAKQNQAFLRCIDLMLSHPDRAFTAADMLPQEYRRQWRAYVNGNADKPSAVMEFVPLRRPVVLVWMAVLSVLAEICFGISLAASPDNRIAQLYFVAYLLCWVVAALFMRHINNARTNTARKLFGKFVALANKQREMPDAPTADEVVKQISYFSKNSPDNGTLAKVADLLRKCGLDKSRTVDEQRKLNNAVNKLLLAYADKMKLA